MLHNYLQVISIIHRPNNNIATVKLPIIFGVIHLQLRFQD
uniref:Uncharacterized protein n=1 Tax=Arundo donax TaxID=35708 RepID=A0A0A9GHA8_ARUDO